MGVVATRPNQLLSQVLERTCIDLQLRPDQLEHVTESFRGVTTWLGAAESGIRAFSPFLFSQGSLRLDTTVRPILQAEFDLDIVCKLDIRTPCLPSAVYELIWKRLQEHGTYRRIAERMPRCIRLNYAEDSKFHLDVVPAIPDSDKGGNFLLIPDRPKPRLVSWKTSNPIDYSAWFEYRTALLLEKMARFGIEPLRQPLPSELKSILTKTVQLLKRWRDVQFIDDLSMGPPSIILTTLAACCYGGQGTIVEAMDAIVEGLVQIVDSGVREIHNPVNDDEVISEKWQSKPETYDAFVEAVIALQSQWSALGQASGITNVAETLRVFFGEPAVTAVKEITDALRPANGSTHVTMKQGLILPASAAPSLKDSAIKSRPHTFYGD